MDDNSRWFEHYFRHLPMVMGGYDVGETAGCTWYIDAEKKTPPALLDKKVGPPGWNFDTPGGRIGI